MEINPQKDHKEFKHKRKRTRMKLTWITENK